MYEEDIDMEFGSGRFARRGIGRARGVVGRIDARAARRLPQLEAQCDNGKAVACRLVANIEAGRIRGRQAQRLAGQVLRAKGGVQEAEAQRDISKATEGEF